MNKPLILVVEDDAPVRNLITTTLKAHDYRFQTAAAGEAGVLTTASQNPDNQRTKRGLRQDRRP